MRPPSILIAAALCAFTTAAAADQAPTARLSGRVLDARHGTPVEDATVLVAGPNGVAYSFTSDAKGTFTGAVDPGSYILIFVYGSTRSSTRVTVTPDKPAWITGKVDATEGEVIVIREKLRPPVPAKAANHKPHTTPPYSDRAIVSDAWTKAFLLLDIDETGVVRRMKWIKRPGFDLEKIALAEVKKLQFTPARNTTGAPIRSWLVWHIEWPSAWWLDKVMGTRAGMGSSNRPRGALVRAGSVADPGRPQRDPYLAVPCAGSGPWNMDSVHPTYRDCSKPDLGAAEHEPWFTP